MSSGPHPLRVIFDPVAPADARLSRVHRRGGADAVRLRPTAGGAWRDACWAAPKSSAIAMRRRRRGASARCCGCCAHRGCSRVFVEGGGVTVSAFLEANLLDRLHLAIAPVLIGDGRPAIRLRPAAPARLRAAALSRVPDGRRRAVRLRPRGHRHRRDRAAERVAAGVAHHLISGPRPHDAVERSGAPA